MTDLALSILFSSLIFVVFKLFHVFKIQTLYAIVVNYVVACLVGISMYDGAEKPTPSFEKPWLLGIIMLGVLFILVFNIIARTSQLLGVSVASVATKMSLVIPVIAGVLLYKESLSFLEILGILFALPAVYFASVRKESIGLKKNLLLLPFLVFLGSGIIDASVKYLETLVSEEEFALLSSAIFAAAATTGIVFILIRSLKTGFKISWRTVLGGVALGIPNFFSLFFLLRALQNSAMNSASIFTINNVAILMLSTLLGILLFKEHISIKNWAGIGMAIISILLVALSS